MRIIVYLAIAVSLFFVGCSNEPTLQKFFVENSEKKDFIALDLSSNILKIDETKLSLEQKSALKSFDKMNIIAFQTNGKNEKEYLLEKDKINTILKDKEYQQLIKVGSGSDGASISFVGTEDKIDEFILFANKKDKGFGVVRVTGENMNANSIMTMLSLLKESNVDLEQLKPLEGLLK
jgi:hypothetical protein